MENYCRLRPNHAGIVGQGVKFERIRRVTGYLVGTLDRFNDAKRTEVSERVKHMHLWCMPFDKAVSKYKVN